MKNLSLVAAFLFLFSSMAGYAAESPRSVPQTAALRALDPLAPGAVVYRAGYYAPGDGGGAFYTFSTSACSLNSGAGDGGSQVEARGGGCWLLSPSAGADPRAWGAQCGARADATAAYQAAVDYASTAAGSVFVTCPLLVSGQAVQPTVAVVGNLTGPQAADATMVTGLTQSGTSAQQIYDWIVCASPCGGFNVDAVRGVAIAPDGSTGLVNGLGGYVLNKNAHSSGLGQAAGMSAYAISAVDYAKSWAINSICTDNEYQTLSGGAGRYCYNEFDLNITSPSTQGAGLQIGGTALPRGTTLPINGLAINKLWGPRGAGTGTAMFANGVIAADACCAIALDIGASALSGSNVVSMPAYLAYRDSGGSLQNVSFTASGGASGTGRLAVGGTSGGTVAATTGIEAGGIGAAILGGDVAIAKGSNPATGPGAGYLKLEVIEGTNPGTCKLIAFAGTSSTPTTIADNIGGGC
jgi:hypothetical protein